MNRKISNGLVALAIPIGFFVISHFVGVDASKPYSEYPKAEGKILMVERLKLERSRPLRATTYYYEIRVHLEGDGKTYFYRSPYESNITRCRARIHKNHFAKLKYQERSDRGMNRIMDLSCNGIYAIPFNEIVSEAIEKDKTARIASLAFGLLGAILVASGIKEKRNANQAPQTTAASRRV